MMIKIDPIVCSNIENLLYDLESRRDVIVTALTNYNNIDNDLFNQYHSDYQDCFIKYNKAKQEMIDKYVGKTLTNKHWHLHFSTCELEIED